MQHSLAQLAKDIATHQVRLEVLQQEFAPQKFCNLIRIYLMKEISGDEVIWDHLISLTEEDLCYEIYRQLKLKVHVLVPQAKGGYKDKLLKLPDFMKEKEGCAEIVITEIVISNLALMSFAM